MATLSYTVGTGGDYAKWSDVWAALVTASPLLNDYIFTQISDLTEDNWNDAAIVQANGKTIILQGNCYGDPTDCYITSLSGSKGKFRPRIDTVSTTCTIYIQNLYFKQITNNLLNLVSAVSPGYTAIRANWIIRNCLIEGYGTSLAIIGLYMTGVGSLTTVHVYNVKIWNCGIGIDGEIGEAGSNASTVIYENITIYACNRGFTIASFYNYTYYLRNVVSFGCTGSDFYSLNTNDYLINCADSDNSIANDNATTTNCITGVTTSDFDSVVDTDFGFLRLPLGTFTVEANVNPTQGVRPLLVAFRSEAEYTFGPSILRDAGIAPTLTTVDISGNTYGDFGGYPIGCHNAEII